MNARGVPPAESAPAARPAASSPTVGAKEIAIVVLLGLGLGGLSRHWTSIVVLVAAIVIMFDARAAGMRRDPDKKGLLNLDPLGWGLVNVVFFAIGWPLYIVSRAKIGVHRGNVVLFAVICNLGALVFASLGYGLVTGLRNGFSGPPPAATVQCKGDGVGLTCVIEQTQGKQPSRVCWTTEIACSSGTPVAASRCVEAAPGKSSEAKLTNADFEGIEGCGKLTGIQVKVDKIENVP